MHKPSTYLTSAVLLSTLFLLRCGDDSGDDTNEAGKGGSAGTGGAGGKAAAGSSGKGAAGKASAGSAGSERVCEPGETQTCRGPGACNGAQACRDDGSGWGACDCGNGSGGDAGAGGSGANPGSGGDAGGAGDTGSGGSNAGMGGQDNEAGAGGGGPEPACDVLTQAPCGTGERCTMVLTSEDPFATGVDCVADGTQAPGNACTRNEDEIDDCVAGSICSGTFTGNVCREFCDPEEPAGCAGTCVSSELTDGTTFGRCEPPCDLLAQECAGELACVFTGEKHPICITHGDVALGEDCNFRNECGEGAVCIVTEVGEQQEFCTQLCNAVTGGPCGTAEVCLPLQMFSDDDEIEVDGAGTCLPCSHFGTGFDNCALLETGGCDAEGDCDPLTADLNLNFMCDLDQGKCVLEP